MGERFTDTNTSWVARKRRIHRLVRRYECPLRKVSSMRSGPPANSTPRVRSAEQHAAHSTIAATPIHNRSTSCQGSKWRTMRLAKTAVITTTSAAPYPDCFNRRSLRCFADSKADIVIGEITCELPYTIPIRMHNNNSG